MKTAKEISEFYDSYSANQQKMWHNERHFFLLDQLKKNGLKPDSVILEIGCGIGTMTNLIAPYIKTGKIISSDISAKSIEMARINNREFKCIEFIVADSTDFTFPDLKYDFIILFDVLEHIQTDYRAKFISMIADRMRDDTLFLINVPAPHAHIHAIENFPDLMQIVEIPVHLHELLPVLTANSLEVNSFFTYDLWQNDEYQFYVVKKASKYVMVKKPAKKPPTIISRIFSKALRMIR